MKLTYKVLLLRGLAAGAVGGLATALFIRFVTEIQIGKAIDFEDFSHLGSTPGEAAMFARSTQNWGGMAALIIFGTAVGTVLALVVALLHHRIRANSEFGRTVRVAAAAFVATALIPGLKYPPNPPTVGDPDTISQRTFSYLLLMVFSVLVVAGAFLLWERLTERSMDAAPRFGAVAGAFCVAVVLAFVLFPKSPDPIEPPDNDATPALVFADDAPTVVLDQVLEVGRQTGSETIRNPQDTSRPLDLATVDKGSDLRGTPVAISTTKLRSDVYTTMVWHFRTQSFAGLLILWIASGSVMGYLLDRHVAGAEDPASAEH